MDAIYKKWQREYVIDIGRFRIMRINVNGNKQKG